MAFIYGKDSNGWTTVDINSTAVQYVDATLGNDGNNGLSSGAAVKTISQAIANSVGKGGILLKRGESWSETFTVSVENLAVMPYGSGVRPIINGRVYVSAQGVRLMHLDIIGANKSTAPGDSGIETSTYNHLTVEGCHITGGKHGIFIKNCTDFTCLRNVIDWTFQNGIYSEGMEDVLIDGCVFDENGTGAWDHCVYKSTKRIDGTTYPDKRYYIHNCFGFNALGTMWKVRAPSEDVQIHRCFSAGSEAIIGGKIDKEDVEANLDAHNDGVDIQECVFMDFGISTHQSFLVISNTDNLTVNDCIAVHSHTTGWNHTLHLNNEQSTSNWKISNVNITDNIIADNTNNIIKINAPVTGTNNITGNELILPLNDSGSGTEQTARILEIASSHTTGINWEGNTCYAANDSPRHFSVDGGDVTFAGYESQCGDTTATWSNVSYTDADRDLSDFNGVASTAAAIAAIKTATFYDTYDTDYNTFAAINYIRAGFDKDALTGDGGSTGQVCECDAGPNQQEQSPDDAVVSIQLDGTATAGEGETINSISWTIPVVGEIATTIDPLYSFPVGTTIATLTVGDTGTGTDSDTVTITILSQPITVSAGSDQSEQSPDDLPYTIQLAGTPIAGPSATISSYSWSIPVVGEIATIEDPTYDFPVGVTIATLTVHDTNGGVAADDVQITIQSQPCWANAGVDIQVQSLDGYPVSVDLLGTGAAGPGETIDTITWAINWEGVFAYTFAASREFPIGETTVYLDVYDTEPAEDEDSLIVTVLPPPVAGGAQPSRLGEAVVARSTQTCDPFGNAVGANEPRYGKVRLTGPMGEWTNEIDSAQSWWFTAAGYDRDNTQEIMVGFCSNLNRLYIWEGDDIDTAYANLGTVGGNMATVVNAGALDITLAGFVEGTDAATVDTIAYFPRAMVTLPGCILVMCERSTYSAAAWHEDGIALFAIQHDAAQTRGLTGWTLSKIGETNGAFGLDNGRGKGWSMASYFPAAGSTPDSLLEAFIPMADYQAASSAPVRGECYLARASRSANTDAWTVQWGLIYQDSSDGTANRHFHSAGWTPRGLILSIGDNADNSEVKLFTAPSDDWSTLTYSDTEPAATLTKTDAWHGGDGITGNQWVGACVGKDINTLLVGGDETTNLIYEITIPESPASEVPPFHGVYGWKPEMDGAATGKRHIGLYCKRPAPERNTDVLWQGYHETDESQDRRLLYSPNAQNFCTMARIPTLHPTSSPFDIYKGKAVSLANYTGAGVSGLFSMPIPEVSLGRPLQVSSGGENLIILPTATTLQNCTSDGDNDISVVTDDDSVYGFGPVYEVLVGGDPPGTPDRDVIRWRATSATTDITDTTHIYMVCYVKIVSGQGTPIRLFAYNSANGNYDYDYVTLGNTGEWQRIVTVLDAAPIKAVTNTPVIAWRFEQTSGTAWAQTIRFQVEGVYLDGLPPYPIEPTTSTTTTGVDELVTFALPKFGDSWSLAMSLNLPESGRDWHGTIPVAHEYVLATLWYDASNYIEIKYDQDASPPGIVVTDTGGSGGSGLAITDADFGMNRGSQTDIMISSDGTNLNLVCISAGRDESLAVTATDARAIGAIPTELRISNNDQSIVPDIEINRIAVDANNAKTTVDQMYEILFTSENDRAIGNRPTLGAMRRPITYRRGL